MSQETAKPEQTGTTEPESKPAQEEVAKEATPETVAETKNANSAGVADASRKPLFPRFKPRSTMVFNRNGFPRKNADLRVALNELQKTAETKPQSNVTKPEPVGEAVKTESQIADPKPEENKES